MPAAATAARMYIRILETPFDFYVLGLKYHVHGIDRSHTAVCEAHRADINADAVNTRQRAQINPCALCPRKRTCAVHQPMSAMGQKRTFARSLALISMARAIPHKRQARSCQPR